MSSEGKTVRVSTDIYAKLLKIKDKNNYEGKNRIRSIGEVIERLLETAKHDE